MHNKNKSQKILRKNSKLNIDIHENNYNTSREPTHKTIQNTKKDNKLSKIILKGRLFNLINKSNIMTQEQFNDIKIKLSLSNLEKYKEPKKNRNKRFYYAQNNPHILTSSKNSSKYEDDYINMKDLLNSKFTPKEQDIILSSPQFFQLNSNEFLKKMVDEKHKNLYEILGIEEKKEKELVKMKMKQKKIMESLRENYSNTLHRKNSILLHLNEKSNTNDIINQLNSKNKNKSRNANSNNYFLSDYYSSKNNTTATSNHKAYKSYDKREHFIESKKVLFHNDVGEKFNSLRKVLEKKYFEKFENMKKRKEMIILNNKKKFDFIQDKNKNEHSKKQLERLKKYNERKYIEDIIGKLKRNYTRLNKDNVIGIENININIDEKSKL